MRQIVSKAVSATEHPEFREELGTVNDTPPLLLPRKILDTAYVQRTSGVRPPDVHLDAPRYAGETPTVGALGSRLEDKAPLAHSRR